MPPGINVEQHARLINHLACRVEHWRGLPCTCSDESDINRADPMCSVCRGTGRFFMDRAIMRCAIVGLHSDRAGKWWLQTNMALPDDMVCIQDPRSTRVIGDGDLIIPDWKKGFPYQGELLKRGVDDKLIYRAANGKVDYCYEVDPINGTAGPAANNDPGTFYVQGTDFTLAADWQTVQWVSGRGPAQGASYGVKYNARYEFHCYNPPAQRYERDQSVGQRVYLRKKHMAWPQMSF